MLLKLTMYCFFVIKFVFCVGELQGLALINVFLGLLVV